MAMPSTNVVQFTCRSCSPSRAPGLSRKNAAADTAAPTRYVTVSEASGFSCAGVDLEQML